MFGGGGGAGADVEETGGDGDADQAWIGSDREYTYDEVRFLPFPLSSYSRLYLLKDVRHLPFRVS